jgi:hypothetical protein
VRFTKAGVLTADGAKGDCPGVTDVFPEASVGDVPHVNVSVLEAPFDVPTPLIDAVVSSTDVAALVVVVGGTTAAGVTKERIPPLVVLAPPA